MPDWLQRLLQEREELDQRIQRLTDFLVSDKLQTVNRYQQALLHTQQGHMCAYRTVLDERIADGMKDAKLGPTDEKLPVDPLRHEAYEAAKGHHFVGPLEYSGFIRGFMFATKRALEWRPMETAPRDGTLILVGWKGASPALVYCMDGTWLERETRYEIHIEHATGWLPLPALPEGKHT